jgi:type I restriction enzyme S subunit
MVYEGDFILSNSMSFGRPYIMKTTGCIHDGWLVLQDIDPKISHDYLYYVLSSDVVFSQFDQLAAGSTVRNLNSALVRGVAIPIPPLAEQKRIVARVEELFVQTRALAKELAHSQIELDGLNKSALSHLLASETPEEFNQHWDFIAEHFDLLFQTPEHVAPLRQSILELAVRGKLTRREAGDESARELLKRISEEKEKPLLPVKEDEKPYELPIGWEWARFENVANIATNSVQPDDYQDLPHIAPNYIEKGTGRLLDYKTVAEDEVRSINHRFFPGQLLYSKIRPNLSKAVIVDFEGLCSADMYPLDVFIDTRYLLRFILSSVFLEMVTKNDTRVAMPKVNQNELNKVLIAVPPLAEQERIVKRVEQLLSLCDALEARLQSAEEERGRLVAAVMSTVGG